MAIHDTRYLNGILESSKVMSEGVSAFGELSTTEFMPLTGWAFTYNNNPGIIKESVIGSGTIANNLGHAVLTTGTDSTGTAKIETVRSSRYIPGVGGTVKFTAVFDTPQPNSKQVIGLINGTDGWAFGYDGTTFGILRKQNSVEFWIPQTEWSEDVKPDFDPTKGNVFQIKYQWLGYGMQYFYMEDEEGNLSLVHKIKYTNLYEFTSIVNPNLPLSAYVVNLGNTVSLTLKTPSAIAGVDGDGFNDAISTNVGSSVLRSYAAGNDQPMIAFRMADIYQGKTNRLFTQILRAIFAQESSRPAIFRAYSGGTLNGTWNYISEDISPLEVNKDFTTYTPGFEIGTFPVARTSSLPIDLVASNFRLYAGQTIVFVVDVIGNSELAMGVNWKSFV
jgi:hypothetical protein